MERNPYTPPAARVDDSTGTARPTAKSVWPLWLATGYCLSTGLLSFVASTLVLASNWNLALSLAPWWLYAISYLAPIIRTAAGVLLLRRSRFAVPACCISAAWRAMLMVVLPVFWQTLTEAQLVQPPLYAAAGRADLVVLAAIAWATFGWKKSGALWRG